MRSIRTLFLILAVVAAAAAFAVQWNAIGAHQDHMRDLLLGRDAQQVELAAARVNSDMGLRGTILRSAVGQLAALPDDPAEVVERLGPLRNQFDFGLAFYDREGKPVLTPPVDWPGVESALQTARERPGRPVVTLSRSPEGLTTAIIAVADPASDPPGARVAAGAVSLEALGLPPLLERLAPSPDSRAIVTDPGGRVIYARDPAAVGGDAAAQPGVAEALRGELGAANQAGRATSYAPVQVPGWALVVDSPASELGVAALRPAVLIPTAVLAAIALVAAALAARG